METILYFLPDSLMILGFIGIALGLMVGLLTMRRALSLAGLAVLLILTGPWVDSLISFLWKALPWWILWLAALALLSWIFRTVSFLFLGRRAAAEVTGILAANAVIWTFRALFQLVALPFRLLVRKS